MILSQLILNLLSLFIRPAKRIKRTDIAKAKSVHTTKIKKFKKASPQLLGAMWSSLGSQIKERKIPRTEVIQTRQYITQVKLRIGIIIKKAII